MNGAQQPYTEPQQAAGEHPGQHVTGSAYVAPVRPELRMVTRVLADRYTFFFFPE